MSDKCHYYRQHTHERYLPGLIHSVNKFTSNACKHSMKIFKGSCLFPSSKRNLFVIYSRAIWTRNYAITSHIDRTDMLDKSDKEELFKQWATILQDGNIHPVEERRLYNQYFFSHEYSPGVHTTCNYQFPFSAANKKSHCKITCVICISHTWDLKMHT